MQSKKTAISWFRRVPRLVWVGLLLGMVFLFVFKIRGLSAMNPSSGKSLPYGQSGYWQLVFSDEFEGPQVDSQKWVKCYWWNKNGCTNEGNQELEWYQPENVSSQNGALLLTAVKQTVAGSNGKTYPYTSGMVTTGREIDDTSIPPRFALKYGYVEARVRAPKGQGIWPAIWMLPTSHVSKPEIDIMEILGGTPDTVHLNFHYSDPQGDAQRNDGEFSGTDLTGDWHIFAINWKPGSIDWYIDGKKVRSFTDAQLVPAEPMYLLMNLAVGGDWGGPPDATTQFPSVFEIDYVRVWKQGSNVSLIPVADTYFDNSAPGKNFGSAPQLSVDGSPKDVAFLKYNLTGLAGRKISSAWLRIKTTDETGSGSQNTQTVQLVGPDTWEEIDPIPTRGPANRENQPGVPHQHRNEYDLRYPVGGGSPSRKAGRAGIPGHLFPG